MNGGTPPIGATAGVTKKALGLGEGEALGDIEGDKLRLGLIEGETEIDALGLIDSDGDIDGLRLGDKLRLGLILPLGLTEALIEGEGEILSEGPNEAKLGLGLALSDAGIDGVLGTTAAVNEGVILGPLNIKEETGGRFFLRGRVFGRSS